MQVLIPVHFAVKVLPAVHAAFLVADFAVRLELVEQGDALWLRVAHGQSVVARCKGFYWVQVKLWNTRKDKRNAH